MCEDFNEIWCALYAIGDEYKLIFFNFQHSAIPSRQLLEFLRWNDDATTHDPLRMRITNLPNLT
jgi:hypothetical protein